MKHLLFGAAKDCRQYAHEHGWELDDYKIVKNERDFYGYDDVELHYIGGPYTVNEYEAYHEARRYFISKGVIKDD